MKKVALIGGSFDPIHMGHINMARAALEELGADEVWFIPSQSTPLKDRDLTSAKDRLEMVKLACKLDERFKINPVDLKRSGKSYTIDTLKILTQEHPDVEFTWLIGADQYDQFDKWKDADKLVELADFVVCDRNGKPGSNSKFQLKSVPMRPTPVSSSEIRQGYKLNYLPDEVLQYILDHELYLLWWVKNHVSPRRFAHSVSVARLARDLAKAHGLDAHKAYLAGLFHDICKDMPKEELEKWVGALWPEALKEHHAIWHGYVGSAVVDRIYGIHDPIIKNAIFNHVKGSSYDPYAMIIFIADKLDPTRGYDSSGMIKACMHDLYNGFMLVKRENREFLEKEKKGTVKSSSGGSSLTGYETNDRKEDAG